MNAPSFKKIFLVPALFVAVFFAWVFRAQAASELYLSPGVIEPRSGEVFEVELFMRATDQPINAVAAHISYDTDMLELISYRRTSEKVSFWIEQQEDIFNGSLTIEGLLIDQGWQGNGEKLARMTFRVKRPGSTEIGIDRAALHAYDGTGNNILDRVTHGIVNVAPGNSRPEYQYIATGIPDVDETLTPDILYDNEYVREQRLLRVMPWWSWFILALCLVLFIWSWWIWRSLHRRGIVFDSRKTRDAFIDEVMRK